MSRPNELIFRLARVFLNLHFYMTYVNFVRVFGTPNPRWGALDTRVWGLKFGVSARDALI
jgi:hypothetical protein